MFKSPCACFKMGHHTSTPACQEKTYDTLDKPQSCWARPSPGAEQPSRFSYTLPPWTILQLSSGWCNWSLTKDHNATHFVFLLRHHIPFSGSLFTYGAAFHISTASCHVFPIQGCFFFLSEAFKILSSHQERRAESLPQRCSFNRLS